MQKTENLFARSAFCFSAVYMQLLCNWDLQLGRRRPFREKFNEEKLFWIFSVIDPDELGHIQL